MISKGDAEEGDATPGEDANVTGVASISQNGERVYFDSKAVLTTRPNENGEVAQDDTANPEENVTNLYVYDTVTGHTRFVGDEASVVETTADGQYALLQSARHYEGTNDSSGGTQLFEYDTETEALVRVAVGQKSSAGYECETTHVVEEGYDCDGNTDLYEPVPAVAVSNTELDHPYGPTSGRWLAGNGAVAFVSGDKLTPFATAGGENVYEYRGGNVYLIAPGEEAIPLKEQSRLLGIDELGGDVLFASTESLVPQDIDTQSSWYDAREEGGFPAPVSTPGCLGEACQGPAGAAPSLPSLGGSALTTQETTRQHPPSV